MKRLFLSLALSSILLLTLASTANAALTGTWVPSVRSVVTTVPEGDQWEASVMITPDRIKLDGLGKINVLVEIPDDYVGPGADELAGSKFTLNFNETELEGTKPGDTSLTVIFTVSKDTEEVNFYGVDDVVILQK